MLMKKRMVSVNQTEINYKIAEHMKKKCESQAIKDSINHNKIISIKTPNKLKFCTKIERSYSKSPLKKMTFDYDNSNYFSSKSKFNTNSNVNNGYCLNLEEENSLNQLSSRIEKHCNISRRLMNKSGNKINSNSKSDRSFTSSNKKNNITHNNKAFDSKSPLKFYLDQKNNIESTNDNFINYTGNEYANQLNISTCGATSIRKMFDFDNEKKNTISKCLNKSTIKTINKDSSNKTNSSQISNEIESFNSILEKSRQDKFALDKFEKEQAKKAKIKEIKTSKFGLNKSSNVINDSKKFTVTNKEDFQMKKNLKYMTQNKFVDFDELMLTEN